jgi:intracellular septation protein
MKFLFDLFPVILFFAAYKFADIYVATSVAICASLLQVGWMKVRRKRVEPMLWASLAIILVFGGATLILQNEIFIKWKPTVLYWLFCVVLSGGALFFRKNLIRSLFSKEIRLPDAIWSRLNWSWVIFFALMGAANLYVAYNYSTDRWVDFKVIWGTVLILLFVVGQALFLARHIEEEKP